MTAREVADYKIKLKEQTQTLMQAGEQLQEEWERTHSNVRTVMNTVVVLPWRGLGSGMPSCACLVTSFVRFVLPTRAATRHMHHSLTWGDSPG